MAITKEQLKDRQNYIGGSDVPIIMGASKFKNVLELFREKIGSVDSEQVNNVYIELGNIMEPKVQELYNVTNVDNTTYEHGNAMNGMKLQGHIDGLLDNDKFVEIKCSSAELKDVFKQYEWQIRFYMYVTGFKECKLINLQRKDELADIVKIFVKENNLPNLHNFNLYGNGEELAEEFKEKVKGFTIKKNMCKTKTVKYNEEKEMEMLKNIVFFTRCIERYKECPFDLEQIETEIRNHFNLLVDPVEIGITNEKIEEFKEVHKEYKAIESKLKALKEELGDKLEFDAGSVGNDDIKISKVAETTNLVLDVAKVESHFAEIFTEMIEDENREEEEVKRIYNLNDKFIPNDLYTEKTKKGSVRFTVK